MKKKKRSDSFGRNTLRQWANNEKSNGWLYSSYGIVNNMNIYLSLNATNKRETTTRRRQKKLN